MTEVQIVSDFWNTEPGWRLVPELSKAGFLTYEKAEGDVTIHRRVYTETENLMAHAAVQRDVHEGKRFPLDAGFVIGSIPLSLKFSTGYLEAEKNEDMARIKRFWNEDDRFQPFRHWNKTI